MFHLLRRQLRRPRIILGIIGIIATLVVTAVVVRAWEGVLKPLAVRLHVPFIGTPCRLLITRPDGTPLGNARILVNGQQVCITDESGITDIVVAEGIPSTVQVFNGRQPLWLLDESEFRVDTFIEVFPGQAERRFSAFPVRPLRGGGVLPTALTGNEGREAYLKTAAPWSASAARRGR